MQTAALCVLCVKHDDDDDVVSTTMHMNTKNQHFNQIHMGQIPWCVSISESKKQPNSIRNVY